MQRRMTTVVERSSTAALTFAYVVLVASTAHADADDLLVAAEQLRLRGNLQEAEAKYGQLTGGHPVEASLGLARTLAARGRLEEANQALEAALKQKPQSARLTGEMAAIAFRRGALADAARLAEQACQLDADCIIGRWITAEVNRVHGRLDAAEQGCKWLIDYYNTHDIDRPESQRVIGLAAARYARWKRIPDQFNFLVNEFYPEILAKEKNFWPARYESGLLYLEKYNRAEASRELAAALAINPRAAEVHAALARLALQSFNLDQAQQSLERALELNPRLVEAHRLEADFHIANFDWDQAFAALERAIELNSSSEETLGRLAAAHLVRDGKATAQSGRFHTIRDDVLKRNPHAGGFFYAMASTLELARRYPLAGRYYREAVERMPRLVGPRTGLGMMYMRLGQEDEARRTLDEAFTVDPFNVRVSNMLKVLEVLDTYDTVETEHFLVRYDPRHDALLARFAADYLEKDVYPELCEQFGFEPQGKSLFEIFNRARNTRAHGWFSARMVGLPYVGTVGACAGRMVALASPNDMPEPFNWARVLKHEFVHVLNLQQTDFNIPHWFTEALAVLNEGYPRPELWNGLLAQRVPRGEVFNLDTINLGFIRPNSSLDWQMAYCQSELYAQYMLDRFGEDALAQLLACYADNLTTVQAIRRAFDTDQEDFEKGYRRYLQEVVEELPAATASEKTSFAELVRAQAADPKNADLTARLAQAYLLRGSGAQAGRLARAVLVQHPRHPLATYVMARLRISIGETQEAISLLEACLDPEAPQENVVALLAGLRLKRQEFDAAERLYRLAAKQEPDNLKWTRALARVYLLAQKPVPLFDALSRLAEADADDFAVRKKLAQLAAAAENYEAAVRWGVEAIQIDVTDADVHADLAAAHQKQGDYTSAIEACRVAIQLEPDDVRHTLALAKLHLAADHRDAARRALKEVLRMAPGNVEATALLESIEP